MKINDTKHVITFQQKYNLHQSERELREAENLIIPVRSLCWPLVGTELQSSNVPVILTGSIFSEWQYFHSIQLMFSPLSSTLDISVDISTPNIDHSTVRTQSIYPFILEYLTNRRKLQRCSVISRTLILRWRSCSRWPVLPQQVYYLKSVWGPGGGDGSSCCFGDSGKQQHSWSSPRGHESGAYRGQYLPKN